MRDKKYSIDMTQIIVVDNHILYRIEALYDFDDVQKGDLGGYIENENNLSQEGTCWVYGSAAVYDFAKVFGDAKVYGSATVYGNALVNGNARVFDNAKVFGDAAVYGQARIGMKGFILSSKDYVIVGPIGSRGGFTSFYKTNNGISVSCGCFNSSIEEFDKKVRQVHSTSSKYRKEYLAAINFAEYALE